MKQSRRTFFGLIASALAGIPLLGKVTGARPVLEAESPKPLSDWEVYQLEGKAITIEMDVREMKDGHYLPTGLLKVIDPLLTGRRVFSVMGQSLFPLYGFGGHPTSMACMILYPIEQKSSEEDGFAFNPILRYLGDGRFIKREPGKGWE